MVTRTALCFVHGDGVSMLNRTGGEVLVVESTGAVLGRQGDRCALVVDVGDGAGGAVADPVGVVVLRADHLVADLEGPVVHDDRLARQLACRVNVSSGPTIEVVNVRVASRHHQGLVTGGAVLPPLLDHPVTHGLGVRGGDDPLVDAKQVNGHVDIAGAELLERGAFGWVVLASVLGEGQHRVPVSE